MLHVYRADRADALVAELGKLLSEAPADPFASDLVCVPTRGVERWLTQTLATSLGVSAGRRDGIVANVSFPSPREITEQAIGTACGIDLENDPWSGQRLIWTLLDVVDAHLSEPWLTVLSEHLRDSAGIDPEESETQPRRLVTVRHLAQLFDRYSLHRPGMLGEWAQGSDVDGSGQPLAENVAWQAELWRRVRDQIHAPDPAERLQEAVSKISGGGTPLDLPDRLSLFGLTRLPVTQLEVLRSIASTREVSLFVLHPSPALWTKAAAVLGNGESSDERRHDPTAALARNPLLSSWGRDARELQVVLGPAEIYDERQLPSSDEQPTTLLSRIQSDVRTDRRPADHLRAQNEEESRPLLQSEDRSIEVHSCHGRARQVEVLRDAVLHVLGDNHDLQPRDVIVMCPDIETFAPLIHATFGVGDTLLLDDDMDGLGLPETKDDQQPAAPPDLRVRLADRALRQTNPVLGTIGRLLELADERVTASQLLDFADRAPVRRRFGLDDDDLSRLEDWIADTQIRWGLDSEHRASVKLDSISSNTWAAGLDRLLLGVTMTEDDQYILDGVLPFDDVESGAIDLAGRFAELISRVHSLISRFSGRRTIDSWAEQIANAADLLTATSPRDAWQRTELDQFLSDLVDSAAADGPSNAELDITEVRDLLSEQLRGRPTRANFRTGHLTFCTLSPMRSVPHRVVCLLGLDDTVFPRKASQDGDDLILAEPHVGDHDGRTEDRQMLLDALLAAQDKLIITYTGNDERTNAPCPPSVPVGELLDVVDATVHAASGLARDVITVRHPLQPFDAKNFIPGALKQASPFSFDHNTLEGARALSEDREKPAPFLSAPLAPLDERVIDLDHLVRFVEHPSKAFLRQRFGISLGNYSDELKDRLPIELDGLESWAIGDRMLRARLDGHTLSETLAAERARGALPPGSLADEGLAKIEHNVEAVVTASQAIVGAGSAASSRDARVQLDDGRLLSGTVGGLHGDQVRSVIYSRLGPKHRLAAWVRLVALTAASPENPWEAITIGRLQAGKSGASVTVSRIPPLGGDEASRRVAAMAALDLLLDLFDRGLREPPPIACTTSAAYAAAAKDGKDAVAAGSKAWETVWKPPREDQELEHRQLLGGTMTFEELLTPQAAQDETGPGWDESETSRFGRWSIRLWSGLLAVEELTNQ